MSRFKPIRKIMAAIIVALCGNGGALILYLEGALDGPAALAAGVAAVLPVIAGYLVPERPSDDAIPGGEPLDV